MQVTVMAHKINPTAQSFTVEIPLSAFESGMDAEAVKETLDIIICQDANVIDIDEEDLYQEAERVYQALRDNG